MAELTKRSLFARLDTAECGSGKLRSKLHAPVARSARRGSGIYKQQAQKGHEQFRHSKLCTWTSRERHMPLNAYHPSCTCAEHPPCFAAKLRRQYWRQSIMPFGLSVHTSRRDSPVVEPARRDGCSYASGTPFHCSTAFDKSAGVAHTCSLRGPS